jgi:hypothetical protein
MHASGTMRQGKEGQISIKSVKSIIKFKKILRNFLLEKSFYSEDEFMTVDS